MKTKLFVIALALIIIFNVESYSQSRLLRGWHEYIAVKIPDGGKKQVEVAELIFYITDKKGNIMDEIARPVINNPISIENVDGQKILLNLETSKAPARKKSKTADKSDVNGKKEPFDFTNLTLVTLLHEKSQFILSDGVTEVVVNHEDIADQCIGKFLHEGVNYAVTLNMKKAVLDRSGKLIFI